MPKSSNHQPMRTMPLRTPIETTVGKHIQPQPNGCWLWNGKADKYGQSKLIPQAYVHRFVYETLVGRIPEGQHIHHTCETPGCCNPAHLHPVTPAEHRRIHAALPKG